jgi:hypothetical protein
VVALLAPAATPQLRQHAFGLTDEDHADIEIARRRHRTVNFGMRGAVAAHRIHHDFACQFRASVIHLQARSKMNADRSGSRLDFGIDANHFTAFVMTALRADTMRHTRLLTVRASLRLRRAQSIMRTAFSRARFGMSSFWIRHNNSFI